MHLTAARQAVYWMIAGHPPCISIAASEEAREPPQVSDRS